MELQKSLLETWNFFSRFFNTFTADDKYPLLVETTECTEFRSIYLKKNRFFLIFFCIFQMCIKFRTFSKKDDTHSLCISEITDHEKRA